MVMVSSVSLLAILMAPVLTFGLSAFLVSMLHNMRPEKRQGHF